MKIKNNGQVNNNTYDVFILTDVGLGKSVKLTTTTYPIQQRLDGGGKEMNTLEKLRSVLQKRLEDGTPTHITIRVGVVENNIELLMVSCALSPSSRVCYISKSLEQEDKFYSLTEDMDVSSCLAIINLCI